MAWFLDPGPQQLIGHGQLADLLQGRVQFLLEGIALPFPQGRLNPAQGLVSPFLQAIYSHPQFPGQCRNRLEEEFVAETGSAQGFAGYRAKPQEEDRSTDRGLLIA